MLGIALGAFMEGFKGGVDMRGRLDDVRAARKLRLGVEAANTEGKAQFDADVKAGKADAGDWDSFYNEHVIPKISNEYREAGDIAKASQWDEFADSSAARKGSKLFASGLQKLQMGDVQAGLDDMVKAANTGGYGPDGKLKAAELYDEGAGEVTGYKLTFTRPDGTDYTKNVAKDDLPNFFAATVNPKAAFETKLASDAAEAKADLEVKTHGRKKLIEKELGVGEGAVTEKDYVKAIQDERKRIEESISPEYQDMTGDEKEALARKTVDARLGKTPSAPAEAQVYVDPDTGEQVAPTQQAAPAAAAAAPTQQAAPAPAAPAAQAAPAPNGIVAPTSAAQPTTDREAAVSQAAQLMKQGGDPQKIAAALQQAGIPPEQWPVDVVKGVQPGLEQ